MDNLFSVKGKNVCIIGGTGLIGSRLADAFAKGGACVFIGTRSPERHQPKRANIKYIGIDIRSSRSIRGFINTVTASKKRIDVWINCALPKLDNSGGSIEKVSPEAVAEETASHLIGFYRCCREVLVQMKKQGKGTIINFGSIYGDLSPDFRIYKNTEITKSPAYPMIEGGINMLTKYLACYAAGFNVRVNAVCPGGVLDKHSKLFQKQYSNRVPMARMARADEIIGPVLFLASQASSYMTGHLLYVDGGLRAW